MLKFALIKSMMKDAALLARFLLIPLFLLIISCSSGTDSVPPPPPPPPPPLAPPLAPVEVAPVVIVPLPAPPATPPPVDDQPAVIDSESDSDSPLARDALLAAFSMIRDSADLSDDFINHERSKPKVATKKDNSIRAAILIPMTGSAKTIGEDLQRVANLAVFTLQNQNIDLTFHDTAAGVENAMAAVLSQQVDVIIGPLFAEDTKRVKGLAAAANIPLLSLSNDRSVAGSGAWILGQTPEQEIAAVLAFALDRITPIDGSNRRIPSLMIITQDSEYGQRMGHYAANFIRESGQASADTLTLPADILNNEAALRHAIKTQVKWVKSTKDNINLPHYDMVLIAGDVPFSLRVSPVLSWYDLDSERVQYLGSSLWNRPAILQEPSLIGGWFAGAPSPHYKRFQKIWQRIFPQPPSLHAVLIFDAIAMVSASDYTTPESLRQSLTNPDGFIGFGGQFKLLADGNNIRSLEIREIKPNTAAIIAEAGDKF